MLPKKSRLTRADVALLMHRGATYHTPHLTLRALPSPDRKGRFGFIASRKVAPSAVARNRLRRRGYGALERLSPTPLSLPLTGAFFFKRGADILSPDELRDEVGTLISRCRFQ